MGSFDIEHSSTVPTGSPGAVRASLDVDTGQTVISKAVFQAGAELQGRVQKIDEAGRALEYSSGKRKIREYIYAAQDAVTGDEAKDDEVWKKALSDIDSVTFDDQNVNMMLQRFKDDMFPTAEHDYAVLSKTKQAQNVHAAFKAEGQTYLAKGDLVSYQELLDERLASEDITQAEYDARTKSAMGDSLLQQARDLLATDDASSKKRGLRILEDMTDIEDIEMSTEQLEYKNKLQAMATKENNGITDKAIASVVVQMDNDRNKTPLEKEDSANQMKQYLVDQGVDGDDLNQYFKAINDWAGTDKSITDQWDPTEYAKTMAQAQLTPNEISDADIWRKVGLGTNGGLSSGKARELVKLRQTMADTMPSVQKQMFSSRMSILKAMQNADKISIEEYTGLADRLIAYANENKDFTSDEMNEFFSTLTEPVKGHWFTGLMSWVPPFSIGKWYNTKSKGSRDLDKIDQSIQRVTNLRERMQTKAWAQNYLRTPGRERLDANGVKWRFVEKGKTPAQDVYERVQ